MMYQWDVVLNFKKITVVCEHHLNTCPKTTAILNKSIAVVFGHVFQMVLTNHST